jgi:hypothetical protein
MKVSFDFDGTIANNKSLQLLAKSLIHAGHEVFILTSRREDNNNVKTEVMDLANKIGIKHKRVIFSPFEDKHKVVKRNKFDLHFDDDFMEIDMINDNLPGKGVFVGYRIPRHDDILG